MDSLQTALEKLDLIEGKVASLGLTPEIGRKVPELLDYKDMSYREMIITPWRVIYQVKNEKLLVLMILDGRRNLQDLLFKRLMRP